MKSSPATDRGRATRERILDAASMLFYRHGVRATGLDQIIAASGTGKGQLYHYFAGKSDLVHAVIERQVELVLESQEPLLSAIATWDDLDAWLAMLVELHERSDDPVRCPLGALAAELAEDDPLARDALAAGFDRWAGRIADGLRRIQESGGLDPARDCAELAQGVLAAYQGGLLLAQARGELAPLRASLALAATALRERAPASRRR